MLGQAGALWDREHAHCVFAAQLLLINPSAHRRKIDARSRGHAPLGALLSPNDKLFLVSPSRLEPLTCWYVNSLFTFVT